MNQEPLRGYFGLIGSFEGCGIISGVTLVVVANLMSWFLGLMVERR